MICHKIAVNFPINIYQKVIDRARADKVSFSDKAVELIECGLFDYEEAEKHETHGSPELDEDAAKLAALGADPGPTFGRAYSEWCRNPEACKGKGYCPLDPTCGD